jgi:hypothetical protein
VVPGAQRYYRAPGFLYLKIRILTIQGKSLREAFQVVLGLNQVVNVIPGGVEWSPGGSSLLRFVCYRIDVINCTGFIIPIPERHQEQDEAQDYYDAGDLSHRLNPT